MPRPPLSFSMGAISAPKTMERKAARAQSTFAPSPDPCGSAAPRVGGVADVSAGLDGNEPLKGRAAAAHLVLCGVCCVFVCVVCFVLC
jgi:hypothetical protein